MLTLADGRHLDIAVSRPEGGVPLVFHHGTPGCVTQSGPLRSACVDRGLRLVSYSRAGYGSSTRRPGRRVADVAEDVEAILDSIGAERCVVAGWSGGGPHALACGARLAERVAGVLAIASVAPYDARGLDFMAGMGAENIEEFGLTLKGEAELRPYLDREAAGLQDVDLEGLIEAMSTLLPEVDCEALRAGAGDYLVDQVHGAAIESAAGWLDDDLAFVAPWGFDLGEITVPTFLWQGSADLMVPFAHGEWLAQHVPAVTAHLMPGHGHLSVFTNAMDEMLDELVGTI